MQGTETPRMYKYGESKTTRNMMQICHVTSGSGLRIFQTAWFLLDIVYLRYKYTAGWQATYYLRTGKATQTVQYHFIVGLLPCTIDGI